MAVMWVVFFGKKTPEQQSYGVATAAVGIFSTGFNDCHWTFWKVQFNLD